MVVFDTRTASAPAPGFPTFASWDAFVASGLRPLGFFIAADAPADQHTLALAVRASPWWALPIAVAEGQRHSPLVDTEGNLDTALRQAVQAEAVRNGLTLDPASLQFDERVLYFLYLRDGATLDPVQDRNGKYLYRYPVAQALGANEETTALGLSSLLRRGLLENADRIDRTRNCRNCGSAHMHYVDVCPHCSSMHIDRAQSLHCFTCGHVAPAAEFQTGGVMACPQCNTALRHIGVDYDRPLTQFACASCEHAFVEARVVARCLDCNTEADPADLEVRDIAPLRLSAHGRAALRAGQLEASFAALDTANTVLPDYFKHLLNWALTTRERHAEMAFGLVLVRFPNAQEVVRHTGATRFFLMLEEFSKRLQELLRTSDITTRTEDDQLWLFLPFSSTDGLVARIAQFTEAQRAAAGDNGLVLETEVRAMQVPRDVHKDDRASQVMARLQEA